MAAEDGRVRPHVACHVREEIAEQGGTNDGPAGTAPSKKIRRRDAQIPHIWIRCHGAGYYTTHGA
ncbi:hypothetical protein GCM10022255_111930 [Dactylosporangium darangshiense]|uniref:Uncharacterized protein n=1 Tax=Dactylosporangium darangshiense TaxID=579108 RepID=A0ABP8DV01_9ACTN